MEEYVHSIVKNTDTGEIHTVIQFSDELFGLVDVETEDTDFTTPITADVLRSQYVIVVRNEDRE